MRSTVIITVVIIEKSSFGWKWHIWCACLSPMRSTVNTAVVIIWKSSFIQKYCIWCACLLQMRRSWKVTRIITRWCWTSSDPAKGFPQVSQRFVFFIPLVTKLLGWGEECYSGIAVSICLSVICFFSFLCSVLWNYEMISMSLSQPVVCDKIVNEIFMADIRRTIF